MYPVTIQYPRIHQPHSLLQPQQYVQNSPFQQVQIPIHCPVTSSVQQCGYPIMPLDSTFGPISGLFTANSIHAPIARQPIITNVTSIQSFMQTLPQMQQKQIMAQLIQQQSQQLQVLQIRQQQQFQQQQIQQQLSMMQPLFTKEHLQQLAFQSLVLSHGPTQSSIESASMSSSVPSFTQFPLQMLPQLTKRVDKKRKLTLSPFQILQSSQSTFVEKMRTQYPSFIESRVVEQQFEKSLMSTKDLQTYYSSCQDWRKTLNSIQKLQMPTKATNFQHGSLSLDTTRTPTIDPKVSVSHSIKNSHTLHEHTAEIKSNPHEETELNLNLHGADDDLFSSPFPLRISTPCLLKPLDLSNNPLTSGCQMKVPLQDLLLNFTARFQEKAIIPRGLEILFEDRDSVETVHVEDDGEEELESIDLLTLLSQSDDLVYMTPLPQTRSIQFSESTKHKGDLEEFGQTPKWTTEKSSSLYLDVPHSHTLLKLCLGSPESEFFELAYMEDKSNQQTKRRRLGTF
jgi:hypothetical protein